MARTFNYGWDSNLGLLTSEADADNGTATSYGYDGLGRKTSVTEGAGSLTRTTQTSFNDAARSVTVKTDQWTPGDGLVANITNYDELYRIALTQQLEGAGDTSGIKVQTRYLYSGSNSYQLVSNPYRADKAADASAESTMGWTLRTFDQNGRITASQSFAGTGLPSVWGGSNANSTGTVSTSYSTNATTVTDEAGSQRVSAVDSFGRLQSVTEYPTGSTSYGTSYGYDALGDLTSVSQSAQSRTFVYDSLKRLIASKGPENSTATYLPRAGMREWTTAVFQLLLV